MTDEEKEYEVPIVYTGQCNYIVKAKSPEVAEEKARAAWEEGVEPIELGNEWERIDRIGEIEPIKLANPPGE